MQSSSTMRLSLQQKKKLSELQTILKVKGIEKKLTDILIQTKWDVKSAADVYRTKAGKSSNGPSAGQKKIDKTQAMQVWNQFKNAENVWDEDGIDNFFKELGVNSETDIVAILASKYMNAATMGEYTEQEFMHGCESLGVCNLKEWHAVALPRLRKELQNPDDYLALYKYLHGFAAEKGFKNVEVDSAIALWELMLTNKCKFINDWFAFLKSDKTELQVITKDTWEMFYDLVQQTQGDLKNFVDDGAWPSIIDEFVEYCTNKGIM